MNLDGSAYVLGHTKDELARLESQAEIFKTPTEEVLVRAGIREGMRVLDVGCGVGDVAMIAAQLVGPSGAVHAIDESDAALDIARARALASECDWITFEQTDVNTFRSDDKFDAITGRFILMHLPDPVAALRNILPNLVDGGAVAFLEMDISSAATTPEMDLFDKCLDWIVRLYRRAGAEPNMGSKLYSAFRAVGLSPQLNGICRIETGPSTNVPDYLSETIRTIMPSLESLGITDGAEIEIDTLSQRLREAALAGDQCFFYPRLVGAWVPAIL